MSRERILQPTSTNHDANTVPLNTRLMECNLCGAVYPIAIGYPARAPHGENRDCTGYFKPYAGEVTAERVDAFIERHAADYEALASGESAYPVVEGLHNGSVDGRKTVAQDQSHEDGRTIT